MDTLRKRPLRYASGVLGYLKELPRPKLLLWGYLFWYAFFVTRYFDGSLALWLNALGVAALIGTGLLVSTMYAASPNRTAVPPWGVFRFYLMPFCVSSFSATIKGKGFVLVFSPSLFENLLALALCATLVGFVELLKWRASGRANRWPNMAPRSNT